MGAARRKTQWIVEVGVVPHHRPEYHLVVAALRAAQPTAHPGLHEYRRALQVPARGRIARDRQVAVEQRFWVLPLGGDLAQEETSPTPIFLGRDVVRRHMDHLVVHQRVHALAGRERLERVGQRRHVEDEHAVRHRKRVGVTVVAQVLQQDNRRLGWRPTEHLALPRKRVGERAYRVRHEVIQGIGVVETRGPSYRPRKSRPDFSAAIVAIGIVANSRHRMRTRMLIPSPVATAEA